MFSLQKSRMRYLILIFSKPYLHHWDQIVRLILIIIYIAKSLLSEGRQNSKNKCVFQVIIEK